MIDTDKYEGCRTKAWRDAWNIPYEELVEAQLRMHEQGPNECTQADLELFADAPLLLDEVKRLRKQLSKAMNWVRDYFTDINGDYTSYENRAVHGDFVQQMEMKE